VLSVDYNKFRKIFLSQKQREQRRSIRQERRRQEGDDRKNEVKPTNEATNE